MASLTDRGGGADVGTYAASAPDIPADGTRIYFPAAVRTAEVPADHTPAPTGNRQPQGNGRSAGKRTVSTRATVSGGIQNE